MLALVTVKLQTGNEVELAATGTKPESIPSAGVVLSPTISLATVEYDDTHILVHGTANVDWVKV